MSVWLTVYFRVRAWGEKSKAESKIVCLDDKEFLAAIENGSGRGKMKRIGFS